MVDLASDEIEQVVGRLSGYPVCPDCNHVLVEINVEKSLFKRFKLDHEKKEIIPENPPIGSGWTEETDYSYRCPNCDSLNIHNILDGYDIKRYP